MTKKILCVGHCVLDRIFEIDELPRSAQKIAANNSRESGGGPASTAAVAVARLGGAAAYVGHLGDDDTGALLLRKLDEQGVDASGVIVVEGFRTIAPVVLVDKAGERCIIVHRRKTKVPRERMRFDFSGVDMLLVDTRWPDGADAAIEEARQAGVPIIIDVDGGEREANLRLVARCDHVVFSDQGLREFAGEGDLETQLRAAARHCPGTVAVTAGANGSVWLIDGDIARVPAFKVKPLDTTGCGDVFHGAYALGVAEGMKPLEAARFASAAAALKAERGQGWDGMPDRAAVEALMAHG